MTTENASRTKFKPGLRSDEKGARLLVALGGVAAAAPSFAVRLEFLRSYETFGKARLECVRRCACVASELSAVGKAERVSVSTSFEGRITRLAPNQEAAVRSDGASAMVLGDEWQCVVALTVLEPSFKLLSIAISQGAG